MRKFSSLLVVCSMLLGLGFVPSTAGAASVTVGGGMDFQYPYVVSGGDIVSGAAKSIYKLDLANQDIRLTHIHPKISIDLSDNVSGDILLCFSEAHTPQIWNAFIDYTPFTSKGFGDNPISVRAGRFFVPFGFFNETYFNPVEMKTVSRPLMYVDHSQEDIELNSGPRPIFMTPYPDTGLLLYGNKYLRGEKDQLWYGVYTVNGLHHETADYDESDRLHVEWETEEPAKDDLSKNKQIGTRLAYTLADIGTLGASYFTGKYDPQSQLEASALGADLHIPCGKANLRFEYAQNPIQWIDNTGVTTPSEFYTNGVRREYTKKGWYAQFDFPLDLLCGECKVAKKFEFATMYSSLSGARQTATNSQTFDSLSRLATCLTFAPEAALKYKLEYQYTMLGSYNDNASNIAAYGSSIPNLSRILLSVGLSF